MGVGHIGPRTAPVPRSTIVGVSLIFVFRLIPLLLADEFVGLRDDVGVLSVGVGGLQCQDDDARLVIPIVALLEVDPTIRLDVRQQMLQRLLGHGIVAFDAVFQRSRNDQPRQSRSHGARPAPIFGLAGTEVADGLVAYRFQVVNWVRSERRFRQTSGHTERTHSEKVTPR